MAVDPALPRKRVAELVPGDVLDLEDDPYADPLKDSAILPFQYALVVAVEQETPDCIALTIEDFDVVGMPPDHLVPYVGHNRIT